MPKKMVHGKSAELPNIRNRDVLVEKSEVDDMEEQRLRQPVSGECQLRPSQDGRTGTRNGSSKTGRRREKLWPQ